MDYEKLLMVLSWVEDVNCDLEGEEIVPGVTNAEFEVLRQNILEKMN